MLDTDFLRLCLIASIIYDGDIFFTCNASQQFEATSHINLTNLRRILTSGFLPEERTHTWLVGNRRLPVSVFAAETSRTGQVHPDIRNHWCAPILIRSTYL
jgi:hypothetical protein